MRSGRPVLGVFLLVVGLLLIAAGAVGIAAFGPSGTLSTKSPPLKTQPDGYALVIDVLAVNAGFPGSSLLGTPTLGADSTGPERMFVGVAPRDTVDEYLTGVAFEAVRQEGSQWPTESIPGTKKPPVPADESLWVDESTGNAPSIEFTPGTASSTFVVMNADATPGVAAQVVVGYSSPFVFPVSIAAIVLGVLALIQGVLSLRGRRRADDEPPTPVDAGPPTTPVVPVTEQPEPLVPPSAESVTTPSEVAPEPAAPQTATEEIEPSSAGPETTTQEVDPVSTAAEPTAAEPTAAEPTADQADLQPAPPVAEPEALDPTPQSEPPPPTEPPVARPVADDALPQDWFRDGGDTR